MALALVAAGSGEHERFHDLAWRAIQTGPPRNPDLMYQLARAQSLSGRPRDALVTLRRLAETGIASDAATNDDFRRVRSLAGWPEVDALIAKIMETTGRTVRPSPKTSADAVVREEIWAAGGGPTPSEPFAAIPTAAPPAVPAPVIEEAGRFAAPGVAPGALAYDSVSRRLLVGHRTAHSIVVVGDGTSHLVDLVRKESAGFGEILAFEIDRRRGDLWVVTGERPPAGPDGRGIATLHKLQLISGRPVASYPAAFGQLPAWFTDVAVTAAGDVFVLDSSGARVLQMRSNQQALQTAATVGVLEPMSLAVSESGRQAYVSHAAGLVLLDLVTRTTTEFQGNDDLDLSSLERLRWHASGLVGVQTADDGMRRIVRLALDSSGRRATGVEILDVFTPPAGRAAAALSGDDLYYLATAEAPDGEIDTGNRANRSEFVLRKVKLR